MDNDIREGHTRNSPKLLALFKEFQDDNASSLRPLCPTRWTLKTALLQSIASNYSVLLEFLEDLSEKKGERQEGKQTPKCVQTKKNPPDSGGAAHSFQTPEAMYRQQYFEVMDTASASLNCRFNPSVFKHMQDVEDFVTGKADCKSIIQFYGDDMDGSRLTLHRDMCLDLAKQKEVARQQDLDIIADIFIKCTAVRRDTFLLKN
ncbi:unnamed protein product [Leuciscus chuanchicus]